ncbi:MAG: Wzz/FepE/Etk N-terminal domain-containing protein [bacterium]|nr:Wzz/FepE/Etk N-terminal domain-containing protein [bacterium]
MNDNNREDEITIDLRQLFAIVIKNIGFILGIPLIACLTALVIVSYIMLPIYKAETTMLVKSQASTQIVYSDILASRQLVKTYREIARSRTIMQEVINNYNLNITPERLREMVDVTLRGDTEIIAISVENTDPQLAATIANGVADAFRSNTIRIMQVENVTVIDSAVAPDYPVKPRKMLTVVVAGFIGGMVGVGIAFIRTYLDNTIKTPDDVHSHLGLPVLGTIPVFKEQDFQREGGKG